jgi:hypothetical protein
MFQGMLFRASVLAVDAVMRLRRSERGQGLTEYAILLGAIALVAGAAFLSFDFGFNEFKQDIKDCITFNNQCG